MIDERPRGGVASSPIILVEKAAVPDHKKRSVF
jgi:hypothetical protein